MAPPGLCRFQPARRTVQVSGQRLLRLLERDGWTRRGRSRHGVFIYKQFPGEKYPRTALIPDKADPLPDGTLGAILSVKQTALGRQGLQALIDRYGLP